MADSDRKIREGDMHAGLVVESVLESSLGANDVGDRTQSDIDVVHVMGAVKDQERMRLSMLVTSLSPVSQKREFRFDGSMMALINDDMGFVRESVDAGARKLLAGLRYFRTSCGQPTRRAIIFVAYDLGALIVKKAISIAAVEQPEWLDIFTSIARVVFSGCLQRVGDQAKLGRELLKFLDAAQKDWDAGWKIENTLSAVQNLVHASDEATALFLQSKITLRSRVFSLCAGDSGKRINAIFDKFTATLGTTTELVVQEEDKAEFNDAFPLLGENICQSMINWAPDRSQAAMEMALMSIVPPEMQVFSYSKTKDHPVASSDVCDSWLYRKGVQVLYLDADDAQASARAAEQICLDWMKLQQSRKRLSPRCFAYRFSSDDPLRASIGPMLTSTILHSLTQTQLDHLKFHRPMLQDQHKLQNAWGEEDLINLIQFFAFRQHTPLLLFGLDECDLRSRMAFWALLGAIASRSENDRVKVIATSSRPGSLSSEQLRGELSQWPDVQLLECVVQVPVDERAHHLPGAHGYQEDLLSRLCPRNLGRAETSGHLQRLIGSMDPATLDAMIRLLEKYSRWPAEMSSGNLSLFSSLLAEVTPTTTPTALVSKIIQSTIHDQDFFQSLLGWMLCGQRPLTRLELSTLLCCSRSTTTNEELSCPSDDAIQFALQKVEKQLRGFAGSHENQNQFRLSGDVLKYIQDGAGGLWIEVKTSAPRKTADFLLRYLASSDIQKRLRNMYQRYEARVELSADDLTPPILSDGRDIIFYAVQALPHHLSGIDFSTELVTKLKDPSGPYTPWANVYWAMSNPFSRPPSGPLKSAWATCVASMPFASTVMHSNLASGDDGSGPSMDQLVNAVRANDEDAALSYAHRLNFQLERKHPSKLSEAGQPPLEISWPAPMLWRATWLQMNRLVRLLLESGMRCDDRSSAFDPSLLYMAARLGHLEILDMLLDHGADAHAKGFNDSTSLEVACQRGHADVVKSLLGRNISLLEEPQPHRPLYTACIWGSWKVVQELLELGANPNLPAQRNPTSPPDSRLSESERTPITAACSIGSEKGVGLLLDHGADPNVAYFPAGTGVDTPLWFAAVRGGSVGCTRLLLQHGADPNHELLKPPILSEIITSGWAPHTIKQAVFDLLVQNNPPAQLERAEEDGGTPLMAAATAGDVAAVRWLLDHGAEINAVDSGDHHALFFAVQFDHVPVVDVLLGHKDAPLLDMSCGHGFTLVQMAVESAGLLRKLLDAGASPDLANNRRRTALQTAVSSGATDAVRLFLEPERRVDVHHRDAWGWSPILDATDCENPSAEVIRMLMESGCRLSDTSQQGWSPLHYAVYYSRPEIVRILLEYHTQDDLERRTATGKTPLRAVWQVKGPETIECIRLLVRAGANVNAQDSGGMTILMRLSGIGPDARAAHDYLLGLSGIDAHLSAKTRGTALHAACRAGDVDLVSRLLGLGLDANARTACWAGTPLVAACMPWADREASLDRAERVARLLVARGADVNGACGVGASSPLCAAASHTRVDMINFLLDKSASARGADAWGRLPIHFAAASGIRNFEAVALVHGEDIMAADGLKKNVLHWAAQFGNLETVRTILQRLRPEDRAQYVNSEDVDGWTPLAWATRPDFTTWRFNTEPQNYVATVKLLIENGADVSVRFRSGEGEHAEVFTPLEMARRCASGDDVLRLLAPRSEEKLQDNKSAGRTSQRKYKKWESCCDFCLSTIYGKKYKCKSCGYDLCSKCYTRSVELEHVRLVADDESHDVDFQTDASAEFEATATSTSTSPSVAGRSQGGEVDDAVALDGETTPGLDDIGFPSDIIEQLELPDLNDLGDFSGM